ncbi:sensor histidine kinase [Psychromonas ossibalaenae]|uniref:sensor histidine kinase n=1 Tax=Psychromonas ossibalaenae TaxID=444922 RepID=UPI000367ECC5|nr:HAMP domain-containing sensor histidine kinase [Psychromonas ossibalaenae]
MVMFRYLKPSAAWVTEWWKNSSQASSVWRLTRLYTSLLLLVVGILLVVLYQLSVGQISRNQNAQMNHLALQQKLLAEELNQTDFIRQFELQAGSSRQYILSLITTDNMYGQLNSVPKNIGICPETARFPVWLDKYDEIRLISGCSQSIEAGVLVIATDDESLYDLQRQFISASLIALLLALLLGITTGLIFSHRVLKRINTFNSIAQRVEGGEMTARVPVSSKADEYDHMALHINTMLSRLEDSFHAIAGVTDAIAHDLRTPLGHLRQQIEQGLIDAHKSGSDTQNLEQMLNKLDAILFTFKAMLELTRLEQKQQSSSFKVIDLQVIINDAADLILPIIEDNQQYLTVNDKAGCMVTGDATLLFRAVYNLLENASKYAGKHAQINVEISGHGFIISDSGPGIPDNEKDKVFQRLYRVEESRSIAGFGIGLPLVRAIIRLHDAQISLQDNHPGLKVVVNFNTAE